MDLLVIQPTALCNLDCQYCYVPDRKDSSRLDLQLLAKLFDLLSRSTLISKQNEIEVLWHAGEPLTVGIEFYRQAVDVIENSLGGYWTVRHSMQTNGTLVTHDWCEFFVKNKFSVGISLDGPRPLHDANRPALGGGGSFDRAMRAIGLFREHGIPINALCVLTPTSLQQPDQIFNFFSSEGIRNIAFNVEEIEGIHRLSSLLDASGLARAKSLYTSFIRSFLRLNKAAAFPLQIREFHSLAQNIKNRRRFPDFVPSEPERTVGAILTMTRTGMVTSWSPELASAAPHQFEKIVLGDIKHLSSIDEMLTTKRAIAIQAEIDEGIERCKRECRYFAVCGGGSPSNKFFEHGSFSATQTLRCALQTQALTEIFLSELS